MITLAASMFDLSGIANSAVDIGATLFFVIGALVAAPVVYFLRKQRRL
jgi:hypothetical protein